MLGVSPLPQVSERRMHLVRWMLTVGWLIMIFSLFWDPVSPYLTDPQNLLSPFRLDPEACVLVQGECLTQQPYALGIYFFWTFVIPGSLLILLVFGHETWRRICPISFLSQIPRALGIQRKHKVTNARTGAIRYELVKIRKDSWLGKNHLYVQFALLALGLAARLLLINADRIALGLFLLLTIGAAIAIGYLYEGKSWCQYFCPMAPVQLVFTGPRGLLGSEAHQGPRQTVTQSMCRTVDKEGKEKSACVGCQSPCMDIDAERSYWETSDKPGRRFVQYGYVGLVLGFFLYSFLYAGSFDYLFSGAWLREANVAGTLLSPGFYIAGEAIPIPKLIAVPLTLAGFVALTYWGLSRLEKVYRATLKQQQKPVSQQQVMHTVFSVCTFFCFNLFFFFSSRSVLAAFPFPVHLLFSGLLVLVSTLWLSRTLSRSSGLYTRESLANSLRRQLSKLTVDFSRFLEGRSMEDLKAEEVYVLAKVLPGFNQEQSLQVYKGVLRETLEQGNADSASSLEVLRPIRQELNIKDEDHFTVLTELGSVEPELLDPQKRRTRESQLRIESYRQALASMLLDLLDSGMSLQEAMQRQKKQIQFLKLEYGMTTEEEEEVLNQILAGEKSTILRKAESLLEQLQQLALRCEALSHKALDTRSPVFKFLRFTAVKHKQQIITKQMLCLLEVLGDAPEAVELARSTATLSGNVLTEMLQLSEGSLPWKQRLKPPVLNVLEAGRSHRQDNGAEPEPSNGSPAEGDGMNGEVSLLPSPEGFLSPQPEMFAAPESAHPEIARRTAKLRSLSTQTPDYLALEPTLTDSSPSESPSEADGSSVTTPPNLPDLVTVLDDLLHELDPLTQALALYGLNRLTPQPAQEKAQQILNARTEKHWLVQETAHALVDQAPEPKAHEVQTLITQLNWRGRSEKHLFQQPVIRVGSDPGNDLVLPESRIASHHAVFYLDGPGFSVLDLSSDRGLMVGNEYLRNERDRLTQGQTIRFGNLAEPTLTVYWEQQPLHTEKIPTEMMGTLDKVLLLFESRFFRSLTPDALVELGRDAVVKVFPRGQKMCCAGDPSDSILLLIDGTADVIISREEMEQLVGTVNVGETIGEMGVLTRQKRSASVVAASDYCRALVIQADRFDAVLRQDPEVARNLLIILSSRLQSMTHKLKSVNRVKSAASV